MFLVLLALLVTTGACSRDAGDLFSPDEAGVLVVDCVLKVDRPATSLLLTRTVSPEAQFVSVPVSDATVRVNGTRYTEIEPGLYVPTRQFTIEPSRQYELSVRTEEGEVLYATTFTPPRLTVPGWMLLEDDGVTLRRPLQTFSTVGDGVWIHPDNQLTYGSGLLEARFDRPDAVAFQVGIESLDEGSDYVIDPDFFDEEDFEQLNREESSPPFFAEDGTLRLPWLAVYFEGRYLLRIHAIDRNWYDLVRSSPALGGGGFGFGGTTGDSFDRPIFNVIGGIGLFGSSSVDSVGFYVHPADDPAPSAGKDVSRRRPRAR